MKLKDVDKENIFGTPEGYFDALPGRIQKRISERNDSRPDSLRLPWYYLAGSAAIAAIVLALIFYPLRSQQPRIETLLAQVDNETIKDYLIEMETSELYLISEANWNEMNNEDSDLPERYLEEVDLSEKEWTEIIEELNY